jgi:cytochrome c2
MYSEGISREAETFLWSFQMNNPFFKKKRKLFPSFKMTFQSSFIRKRSALPLYEQEVLPSRSPPGFLVIEF